MPRYGYFYIIATLDGQLQFTKTFDTLGQAMKYKYEYEGEFPKVTIGVYQYMPHADSSNNNR